MCRFVSFTACSDKLKETALGEIPVKVFSDVGSTPTVSTKNAGQES